VIERVEGEEEWRRVLEAKPGQTTDELSVIFFAAVKAISLCSCFISSFMLKSRLMHMKSFIFINVVHSLLRVDRRMAPQCTHACRTLWHSFHLISAIDFSALSCNHSVLPIWSDGNAFCPIAST
jgi:hypothetical protein